MRLDCPRCGETLVYEGPAPRFCSYCGLSLSAGSQEATTPGGGPPPDPMATVVSPTHTAGDDEHPSAVGGYRLLRRIGGGGMGTVYEAEQPDGRRVALKLIRHEFAESPEAVERFRREGRLASSISHPRCVFVLAADEAAGRPYIVMELMPGRTLHDLVSEGGRLEVREAVAIILDVIEGLQEAHRRGVIHRDIKPSNCFLDADGRVKVGDFGLAKSLIGPEILTRSGAFLGTLLFAAPEQIRNEAVGPHTDVYSVCATLYYLLTGVAPFQGYDDDPAATLARTVSDPLIPMRQRRPELPRALDEIVCRGLARPRGSRWPDLDSLRLALLPFVAVNHSLEEVGWRVSAYLCDLLLLLPVEVAAHFLTARLGGGLLGRMLVPSAVGVAYFALAEWRFGCTLGKWLTRLRVRETASADRPSPGRAGLRALGFHAFRDVGAMLVGLLMMAGAALVPQDTGEVTTGLVLGVAVLAVLPFVGTGVGLALMAVSMRRENGYRGLHEWLSGTETIRLPAPRPALDVPDRPPAHAPVEVDVRVGAFDAVAVLRRHGEECVLACEDSALRRSAWLWLRPGGEFAGRAEVARDARPRWLAGGEEIGRRWDAYVAAPGCLLADLVTRGRPLGWPDTLALLEALAQELEAAGQDGTLPATLGVMQVWMRPGGRPLLLDMALRDGEVCASPLELVARIAALALRRAPAMGRDIHAPLPRHADELLARLTGAGEPFADLGEARAALAEAHQWPMSISRPRRALQVALGMVGLVPGLLWLFALGPAFLLAAYFFAVAGIGACDARLAAEPDEADQREEYRQIQARLEAEKTQVLRSFSGYLRRQLTVKEGFFRERYAGLIRGDEEFDPTDSRDNLLQMGDDLLGGPSWMAQEVSKGFETLLGFLAFPVLWCGWSAITRGGVVSWLAGIRLRGRDGRPASRWRCLLRSAMVWVPLMVLLAMSFWLDVGRVALGPDFALDAAAAWLAWGAWWLALLLLPLYLWAALAWPDRGPHDRIAGTWPVPG